MIRIAPPNKYTVDQEAINQARMIGLCGDVDKRLIRMAKRSAPLTHPEGNRRFDDFVLFVQNKVVKYINRL